MSKTNYVVYKTNVFGSAPTVLITTKELESEARELWFGLNGMWVESAFVRSVSNSPGLTVSLKRSEPEMEIKG